MERKIGELFYVQGIGAIKCVASKNCVGCIFDMGKCQRYTYFLLVGTCSGSFRSDKRSVKFIKINDKK